MKQMLQLHGQGQSIRQLAETLAVSRNTVRSKYLRAPALPVAKGWPTRGSKVDAYAAHLDQRLAEGVENAGCAAARDPRTGLQRRLLHPEGVPTAATPRATA